MITRIEIDGFKSFVDFKLDLPPFLAIAGRNTSGKSNLLDALAFVAAIGRGERMSEAVRVARGDAGSLFHRRANGTQVERMTFAVEVLLDVDVERTGTRWRYECEVGWSERGDRRVVDLQDHRLVPMSPEDDRWPDLYPMADAWRARRIGYGFEEIKGRNAGILEPEDIRDFLRDNAYLDRWKDHRVYPSPLVGSMWVLDLRDVRVLRLEPQDIARPSPLDVDVTMTETGSGLAGWLEHLVDTTASEDGPEGVLRDVSADLARVIREVTGVRLARDDERGDVRLQYETRNDSGQEAPQASDGTLRVTAILAALHNPERRGLLAIEEPENGVFPERFSELMDIVRASATDMEHDDPAWPLRQTLVTSHSPLLLDAVPRESVVFLETVSRIGDGGISRVTRPRRILGRDERAVRQDGEIPPMSETELDEFRSPIAGPS